MDKNNISAVAQRAKEEVLKSVIDFSKAQARNKKYFSLNKTGDNHLFFLDKPGIVTTLKEFFKRWPWFYYLLINLFSSVYYNNKIVKKQVKEFLASGKVVINVGSGNKSLSPEIINTDLCSYPDVDVVADAVSMPFKDEIADLVVSEVTMEHVPNEETFLSEIGRIIRPGGKVLIIVPFIFPYHASPHDYGRWTYNGLQALLLRHGFETETILVISGPASAFTGVLIWFLAIVLSFGLKPLYELWFIFFSLTLWPIKYLDVLLNHWPMAKDLAANFAILGKKTN